ncbi:MAG: ABC transporter ATP-binding protein, partial [Acidimicrobiales bacterium]
MGGAPAEKSLDFRGSGRRLLRELAVERLRLGLILALGAAGVGLSVLGPRILGHATDLIFSGVVGRQLPAGTTQAEAVATLRQHGQSKVADMVQAMSNLVPGRGIDFDKVGMVLLGVILIYIGASIFNLFQGRLTTNLVQRAVFRMRAQVQDKLARLPLSYFDRQPRGEILSRVTNDIDNLQQSIQQTLSQLVTSLLTIVGVLVLMFVVSWQLALIALVTVPASVVATRKLAQRAQPQFINQWKFTGQLNSHIEEMYSGHALVTAFGQREEAMATFNEQNEALYAASSRAQFISGTIQPLMM